MWGIFTVVIAVDQQNATKQQRAEDRYTAQLQRDLETNLTDEQYKNQVLDTYIKDMDTLLEKNNGSLISNPVTAIRLLESKLPISFFN
jgi:hypothetical protein